MTEEFRKSLSEAFGEEIASRTMTALGEPPSVSVRLNPSKAPSSVPMIDGAGPVSWNRHAHMLGCRPSFTLDPLFHSGAYYVQDSSAMAVGAVAREFIHPAGRPLRVLDLCAAPGGKTTDLAASLREKCGSSFILVANEVMRARAGVLAYNVARWGDPCVTVTGCDPGAFASLEGFFDIIVADVPCSGEGMFRKDEQAVQQWSPDNVRLCGQRQRRILADVWPALAEGGILIYSTCTFNSVENDGNVLWAAEALGADVCTPELDYGWFRTGCGYSLIPGLVKGEGQYCAALRKTSPSGSTRPRQAKRQKQDARIAALFSCPMDISLRGDLSVAVPEEIAAETAVLQGLHPLLSGTAAGSFKGKDFIPHADLAMSIFLSDKAFVQAELSLEDALKYLHKDPILLPESPKGIILVKYCGCGLGFVKNLGSRTNSLLPSDRRIRMDIDIL